MRWLTELKTHLPAWMLEWLDIIIPATQVLLILLAAYLLRAALRLAIKRVCAHYQLPAEVHMGARRVLGFLVYAAAILLILERLGVSGSVLWSAFTGFAAVAAVAFFAAWSVLSNIFCTILIFSTRLFRLHDHIEVLESGDKPGLKGVVIDINVVYTTLLEDQGTKLQVPNNLFFQRMVRRGRPPAGPEGTTSDDFDA
ncbi:MAG: mechanosensitive ion channel family protein [Caldimonas manganoxidans]|nr:mechanosensitive ion channel family protein [Caldimonas manganoxidans]